MKLEPKVLENRFVRLEPLAERHKEELREACAADPATWQDLYIVSMLGEAFDRGWDRFVNDPAGKNIGFALMIDGVCRGMSSYLDVDNFHNTVEIGFTYYDPAVRGGAANPSAKRLLMAHAFESGAKEERERIPAAAAAAATGRGGSFLAARGLGRTGAIPPFAALYLSSFGSRAIISAGGVHFGHFRFHWMIARPDHSKPARPSPTP